MDGIPLMGIKQHMLVDHPCSVEIGVKWQDIGAIPMNAPAAAIKSIQPPARFGIIPLTEDELAAQSLPAAIQRLLWPNAQVSKQATVWCVQVDCIQLDCISGSCMADT